MERAFLKKLGYHIVHTDHFLVETLRRKIFEGGCVDFNFPVIERNLYFREPWKVLEDNDPWDVLSPTTDTEFKRVIFVFTQLKPLGKKRFAGNAGDGKWHGSTSEEEVRNQDGVLTGCFKSYLDFRLSKNLESREKGHWMMHEFKFKGLDSVMNNTVLCRITHVVNKDLGIHRAWPKSPFQICFNNFKNRGFFESRPKNKRQESCVDDMQTTMMNGEDNNQRQLMVHGNQDDRTVMGANNLDVQNEEYAKQSGLDLVITNNLDRAEGEEERANQLDDHLMEREKNGVEYDDIIDLDFLDMTDLEQIENNNQLALPNATDDMQTTINGQDNPTQLVVLGDEDVGMVVGTNNLDDQNQELGNQSGLDLVDEQFANQLETELMETEEKEDQNVVVNAEESRTVAIPSESG